ncbi:hypothetical protein QYF36_013599 [Acer negundo]|nr:hypothetical protein QYF36_013599 [Acer negundo]
MEVSLIEALNLPFTHLDAFTFSTKIRLQLLRRTPRLGRHEDDEDGDVRLRASPPSTVAKMVRDFEGGVRVVKGLLRGKRKPEIEDSIFQESCCRRRVICSFVEITPTAAVSPNIKSVGSEEQICSSSKCNEIARRRRHDSSRSRSCDGGVSLVDDERRQ